MSFNAIFSRSLGLSVKLRTPTIKFRYGAARDNKTSAAATSGSAGVGRPLQSSEPIYDFQIPQRFKRRPLSQEEIDYINCGGPPL